MRHLRNAHRRLPAVFLDQSIWIVQSAPNADDHLNAGIFRDAHHLRIPITSVSVGILLEDEMRDAPSVEELREERLRGFANQEQLRPRVDLGDGRRKVRLTVEPGDSNATHSANCQPHVRSAQFPSVALRLRDAAPAALEPLRDELITHRYCHRLGPTRAR